MIFWWEILLAKSIISMILPCGPAVQQELHGSTNHASVWQELAGIFGKVQAQYTGTLSRPLISPCQRFWKGWQGLGLCYPRQPAPKVPPSFRLHVRPFGRKRLAAGERYRFQSKQQPKPPHTMGGVWRMWGMCSTSDHFWDGIREGKDCRVGAVCHRWFAWRVSSSMRIRKGVQQKESRACSSIRALNVPFYRLVRWNSLDCSVSGRTW